ncbi:MAG: hypothetical protein ACREFO_04345 [Acetobacteraceae bacterium]
MSMVRTTDALPYLLAIKSLSTCIELGRAVAIIDRTAPAACRRLLEAHITGIELVELESIPVGRCQHGGTWERLLCCIDRSEEEYVIQLDSDTLTVGPDLTEVTACIAENRAFTLGGGPRGSGQRIVAMPEAARNLDFDHDFIGIAAQRWLAAYPSGETLRYVRGSSAFAGFARGGIDRQRIEDFHAHMQRALGERWAEWGSEQCASNFAIANMTGAIVLPWPSYTNFLPQRPIGDSRFLHFYGTVRYRKGCYVRLGRQAIERIMAVQ